MNTDTFLMATSSGKSGHEAVVMSADTIEVLVEESPSIRDHGVASLLPAEDVYDQEQQTFIQQSGDPNFDVSSTIRSRVVNIGDASTATEETGFIEPNLQHYRMEVEEPLSTTFGDRIMGGIAVLLGVSMIFGFVWYLVALLWNLLACKLLFPSKSSCFSWY